MADIQLTTGTIRIQCQAQIWDFFCRGYLRVGFCRLIFLCYIARTYTQIKHLACVRSRPIMTSHMRRIAQVRGNHHPLFLPPVNQLSIASSCLPGHSLHRTLLDKLTLQEKLMFRRHGYQSLLAAQELHRESCRCLGSTWFCVAPTRCCLGFRDGSHVVSGTEEMACSARKR